MLHRSTWLKRSKFLSVALSLVFLVGCGGTASPAPQAPAAPAPAPAPGGTPAASAGAKECAGTSIRVGTNGDGRNVNPLLVIDLDGYWRTDLMFDPLITLDALTLEPKGHLAEKWDVSPDGKTYTFHLVKNTKFHDGAPLTARDVEFTILSMLQKDYVGPFRARWSALTGAKDVVAGTATSLSGLKVIDDHTIQMTLDNPNAAFLAITVRDLKPVPKHIVQPQGTQKEDSAFSLKPIGSGPYKFVQWVKGDRFIVEANKDYWGGAPCMQRIEQIVIPDMNALLVALESGQLDATITPPPSELPRLATVKGLKVHNLGALSPEGIVFNRNNPILAKAEVRLAIAQAVDWEAFAKEVMRGTTSKADTFISPNSWALNKAAKTPTYNMAKAKELLTQAGYPNGFEIELKTNAGNVFREAAVGYIQAQLAQLGIKVTVNAAEWGVYITSIGKNDFQMAFMNGAGGVPDPDQIFATYHSTGATNYMKINNPQLDKLLVDAQKTPVVAERAKLYAQVQEILAKDVPFAPGFWRPNPLVVSDKYVGVVPSVTGAYWNIKDWGVTK